SDKACECIERYVKVQSHGNIINIQMNSYIEENAKTCDPFKSLVCAYKSDKKNNTIFFSPGHYDSESYFTIERTLLKNCTSMQEFVGTKIGRASCRERV